MAWCAKYGTEVSKRNIPKRAADVIVLTRNCPFWYSAPLFKIGECQELLILYHFASLNILSGILI